MLMFSFFGHSSAISIFILALVGVFYPYNRGALFSALVVLYALTSGIAGYTATSTYLQLEGTNWVHQTHFFGFRFLNKLESFMGLFHLFISFFAG